MQNREGRRFRISASLAAHLLLIAQGCDSTDLSTTTAEIESPAAENATVNNPNSGSAIKRRIDGVPVTTVLRITKASVKPGEKIELEIAPMWEIHAMDAQPDLTATKLDLTTPTGVSAVGKWQVPATARSLSPDGHPAYMGKVVFTRLLAVDESAQPREAEIACEVGFQPCNERQCLEPRTLVLKIPLEIEQH